jgi:Putative peptidoglycan binding domain
MRRAFVLIVLIFSFSVPLPCFADEPPGFDATIFFPRLFNADDPLAARDEYGLLHQGPFVNRTDFEPRYCQRSSYYYISGKTLILDPAYVGALQRDLRRLGYYCGAINGIFSPEVSDAITRLQKNSSMEVTGTLTVQVRRALHLP